MKTRLLLLLAALALAVSAQCATPTCGLTIITHGYQDGDDVFPGWVSEMASAINTRTGASLPIYRFRYDKATATIVPSTGDVDLTLKGGAVVLLDWVGVADRIAAYPAQDVADYFFDYLFERLHNGKRLAEIPIHLIGHSRGTSLNSRLAYRLGQKGIIVDQVTTLDPHPVTVSTATDWVPNTFKNVVFADNYFQTEDFPDGLDILGTYSRNLNSVINSVIATRQHTQIHTYYHGTIDLSPLPYPVDRIDVESTWYPGAEARASTGYVFSRYVRGNRSSLGINRFLISSSGTPQGEGFREAVTSSFQNWPNAGFDQTDYIPSSVFVGEPVEIPYYQASRNYGQTLTFSLVEDTNPFNQGGSVIKSISPTSRQDGTIEKASLIWTPTAADIGNTPRFLRVKASNATGRTRYDYYFQPITVSAAPNPYPRITAITPRTVPSLPPLQTQRITITGSGFIPSSTLSLFDGQSTTASDPSKLTYVSATELKYDLAVGSQAPYWNIRVLNGIRESNSDLVTVTTASDVAAPEAPINPSASSWTRGQQFTLDWTNPSDASGIAKAWVKFGAAPTSSSDGTAYPLPANKPLRLTLPVTEGSRSVHLWLEDGSENRSHNNRATLTLGADITSPVVQIASPAANPPPTAQSTLVLTGSYADNLSGVATLKWHNFVSGTDGFVTLTGSPLAGTFTTPAIPLTPGLNGIGITATDAAGNVGAASLIITYVTSANSGTLGVGIEPPGAVTAGAQWRLVGETTWRMPGVAVSGIPAGSQMVEFKAVDGWITPLPATISVLANQIVTLLPSLGTYGSGTVNQAPDVPSNPYPANGDVNIARSGLTLRWSGGHPTGSPDYAVAFDTVNPPGFIAGYGSVPGRTYSLAAREPLLPATTYYWRVQGKVGEQRTDGPVWRFTTDYSYADLIPYEIAVDGNIQPGANVTVRVKVKNQGTFTSESGCWLNLYLSQTPQGRERRISQFNTLLVPVLAPGAEAELQQSVTLANLPAGQSFIDAWVDSAPSGIKEQDYENNVRSLAIQYVDGQSPVVTSARLLIPFAKTGQSNSIIYFATDDVGIKTMDFYYSVNGGVNWIAIQEGYVPPANVANGVFLPWTIPTSLPLDTNLLVRVVARDASGNWGETNTIPYPILNGTAPTVAMLSPNGGEAWDMNSTQLIRWNVSSPTVITEMKLWFYFGDGNSLLVADIRTNTTGQYSWVLPNNLATANGRIRISLRDSAGNEIQDFSDAAFTIRDTSAPPPAPWTTPELLTLVPAQDVGSKDYGLPKLATDADGSAHLIYKYSNDTGALTAQRTIVQTIFYRKRTGTIWSVPAVAHMLTQIPDANGRSIYGIEDPQIAVDTNGRPHLLWARTFNPNGTSSDNNFREIFYTRFNGTSWDTPVNLSETLPGIEGRITQSYSPRIKIDSANTVHVLWKDGLTLNPDLSLTGLGNIYYRTNNSVLGWSGISQVTVAGSVREPSLYIDQSNRLHLSYMTNIGTILYQSLAGQGWTDPEIITGTGPVFLNSQANAYPHLVWQYFDSAAGVNRVAYSRHGEGSWIPSEFVSSGVPNAGQSKVLVDSFGRAHVLMEGSEGAWELLFHKRREPLGWTSPIRLHLPSQDLAESHSDAALSLMNNEMHVVFAARTNGHLELFYNHASFASTNDIYPPTVAVSAPSPGTLASVGSSLNLQWSAIDDSPLSSISLHYTTNAGATWLQIATNLPNTGTNVWIVPDLAGFTAQVRVSATDALGNTGYGFSGNFSTVDVTPPSISISAPIPPAILTEGSTTNIVWAATDNVGVARVDLDYSLDNGATWLGMATNLASTGTYPWTVPTIPTSTLLLRATAQDAAGFSATFTSQPLTIIRGNSPPLAPASPFPPDGSSFVLTQLPSFRWNSSDPDGDALTYYVRFGSNTNAPLVLTTTASSFSPPALRPQRTYYWQVLATDGKATNTGSLWWSFTTEAGTLPPTSLAEFKRQTNGHFEFHFNGLFGENQVVQASTNLFDWFTVATFGNSNAASVFLDSAATNLNRRFYRVLTP
ncbi:MAG: Ig-like domain-containing protein [Limisphaerales bacterium]